MDSRRLIIGWACALALLLGACADRMATVGLFVARVEDTLGRPLEGVRIRIFSWEAHGRDEQFSSTEVTLATPTTNGLGLAFAKWKAVDFPAHDPRISPDYAKGLFIDFEKAGYIGYSTDSIWHRYTLAKAITANDFAALARMSGARLEAEVRELLAGQFLDPMTDPTEYWLPHANRVRTILLDAVHEPRIAREAVMTLARFGFPEDIEALVAQHDAIAFPDQNEFELCNYLVPALLSPQSPEAWAFLSQCIHATEPGDEIQIALLIGSERSRRMLREYQGDDPYHRAAVKRALDAFGNPPTPVTAATPEALVVALKSFLSPAPAGVRSTLSMDPSGRLALASFGVPECRCGYGATFHWVGDHWVLRWLGFEWIS